MSEETVCLWVPQKSQLFTRWDIMRPMSINENEYIVCAELHFLNGKRIEICKFNDKQNAWDAIDIANTAEYKNFKKVSSIGTCFYMGCFNKQTQILYLVDSNGKLWHVDIVNKIILNCTNWMGVDFIQYSTRGILEIIGDKLHCVFKDSDKTLHIMNVDETKEWTKKTDGKFQFAVCKSNGKIDVLSLERSQLVRDEYTIPKFADNNNNMYQHKQRLVHKELDIPRHCGYTSNSTQSFILMCGGYNNNLYDYNRGSNPPNYTGLYKTDLIIIYDLIKNKIYQSKRKCPFKGEMHAICMRSKYRENLLLFGFINELYKNPEWNNIVHLPLYLKKYIATFIIIEHLHILGLNNNIGKHFKINVDDII